MIEEHRGKDFASHWKSKNTCLENIRTGDSLQKSLQKNSSAELKLENVKKLS